MQSRFQMLLDQYSCKEELFQLRIYKQTGLCLCFSISLDGDFWTRSPQPFGQDFSGLGTLQLLGVIWMERNIRILKDVRGRSWIICGRGLDSGLLYKTKFLRSSGLSSFLCVLFCFLYFFFFGNCSAAVQFVGALVCLLGFLLFLSSCKVVAI